MNITELKELAEKATPGPWKAISRGAYWEEEEGDVDAVSGPEIIGAEFVEPLSNQQTTRGHCWYRDAAYIAAANPAEILELIAQLEAAEQTARYESDLCQQALDSRKEMEGHLEDAQGEIRALRATEAGLREKADRWDFLAPRMLAADFDYLGDGVQALVFEMPNGFSASADAADTIDRARALLEKKE